jgi:hypothetical protein
VTPKRLVLATVLLAAASSLTPVTPSLANDGTEPDSAGLSPYFVPAVTRWEPIILQEAHRRDLDPDLVAAVVWKESLGVADSRGPAGAVGLMMVMPFDWRPSPEQLENPWTNLFWGSRALAQTIHAGRGDLYYSLAAYNGSWDGIRLGSTRRYAASVMGHYIRAVAARQGLPIEEEWVAIFTADGASTTETVTVLGPHQPLRRYTQRQWLDEEYPAAPEGCKPSATAAVFLDDHGHEHQTNVWILAQDYSPLTTQDASASVQATGIQSPPS